MPHFRILTIVAICAMAALSPGTRAEEQPAQPAAEPAPVVDAQARALLEKTAGFYADRQNFRVTIVETTRMLTGEVEGPPRKPAIFDLTFARPNKLALSFQQGQMTADFVSDGKLLTVFPHRFNKYVQFKAPNSPARVGDAHPMVEDIFANIAPLLEKEPYQAVSNRIVELIDLGEQTINDVPARHVKLRIREPKAKKRPLQKDDTIHTVEIWIRSGDAPLIEQVVVDLQPRIDAILANMDELNPNFATISNSRLLMSMKFEQWQFDQQLAADRFAFNPPEAARKVRSLVNTLQMDHEMLGRAAPDIELELLGGGELKLADHRGKDVVILDFWATTCGPCVVSMPTMAKVADAYKDKDVVFYAVNRGEPPTLIKRFLKRLKLSISVAMDGQDVAARSFGVMYIPHTVLIDKQGVIRQVHEGAGPNLEQQLRAELDDMLADS